MKTLLPIQRMRERVELDRADSDVALFYSLLFFGELVTKLVTCALAATIADERDRTRYGVLYDLVRADGIGNWSSALDTILIGPPSQHLVPEAREHQRQLTQRVPPEHWGFRAVELLSHCFADLKIPADALGNRVAVRQWFSLFATLRNKTRGHGAPRGQQCSKTCENLELSINLLVDNLTVLHAPWAFLHQNLSGKYRVTHLGGDSAPFEPLKKEPSRHLPDGIYLALGGLHQVALIESDVDASDFLIANGQFRNSRYEALSYITNERRQVPGERFLTPASQLPSSETQGKGVLDAIGNSFANLPPIQRGYISRPALEDQLREQLELERHPILTLTGPGGIGKTTLALKVLYDLTMQTPTRYETIVWFSARDIDLLPQGPRPVRPHMLSQEDFAGSSLG